MDERVDVRGVVIDPGHGGEDTGVVSNNVKEKDLTLKLSQYMYERFQKLGIPVTIIRTTDETVDPEERARRILAAYGDRNDVIVLSNHINKSESGSGLEEGAEVIYALRNTSDLARSVLEAIGQEGQIMRKYYQRRLPENPSKDYYAVHRDTGRTQPLLIEYGFIDNREDALKLEENLLDYGEAVVRAIAQYMGINYIPPTGSASQYYTVQKNDSLWSIANRFNTTVSELKRINNLQSDALTIGQVLKIPTTNDTEQTPPSQDSNFTTYTVKQGDTLYKIAQNYNTTPEEIKRINGLTSNVLMIGQQLKIPIKNQETIPPQGQQTYYEVQRNDSLYKIAQMFNTTVDAIMKANQLTSTNLSIGQRLIIPNSQGTPPSSGTNNYIVQSGDSLWSIAKKFNTTVDEIKRLNNLSSNVLTLGQVLKIPNTTSTNYITYTVKLNDSLYKIAQNYNTTPEEIKRVNGLTSNVLMIGQQLKIPI